MIFFPRLGKGYKNSLKVGGWGRHRTNFPLFFLNMDPPQLKFWSGERLKLKSSMEERSGNCQMTRIVQNSFHGM